MREDGAPLVEPDEIFWLWPENVPTLALWAAVQTQWRHGFEGPTGLCYAGVRAAPAFRRIPHRDRERMFEQLLVMEREALSEWERMREARRASSARR